MPALAGFILVSGGRCPPAGAALGLTPAPFAFVGAGLGGMLGAFLSVLGLLALAASVVGAVTFTRRAGRRGRDRPGR